MYEHSTCLAYKKSRLISREKCIELLSGQTTPMQDQ